MLVLLIGIGAALSYVKFGLPSVGDSPELHVDVTPDRVVRGKYLANHVNACMDCHSKRDWTQFAGPITPGTLGAGGDRFGHEMGLPGTVYARNITPYGIGDWTDGELFRCITTGVDRNGGALFPLMPYKAYGKMDKEDVYSIIAYLRTLPAIKNDIPERSLDFPLNFIINTIPAKGEPMERPTEDDSIAYGRYLTISAGCVECHSPSEKGKIVEGMEYAGGGSFKLPGCTVRSANLTPDATGLASWTQDVFVKRFKQYEDAAYKSPKLTMMDNNSIMPWMMYARMSEGDLKAIYNYLRTLQPISNQIQKYERNTASL